jgi:glucose-6-phosphate 1-dehydrogenase
VIKDKPVLGYTHEHNIPPDSQTETFVAGRLFIDNFRWAGVPIYIRTGKRLPQKATEIVIQFKQMPKNLYFNKNGDLGPNLLIIRINPTEGIYLLLNAKKQGSDETAVTPIAMEYCNNCQFESPEAYERLFYDAIQGDSTFFTRWDEVSLAWKFVDPIRRAWDADDRPVPTYPAGSWGPERSHRLLDEDGNHWWPVGEEHTHEVVPAVEKEDVLARR